MRPLVLILCCAFAGSASADGGAERENLAKLVGELDFLMQRLDSYAMASSERDSRYRFDYRSLAADMRAMRRGIVEYIDRDLSLARKVPPLRTEYVIDMKDRRR